jgi:aryl-alcohol dehydrogenase-like predicted oxidoreductase
VKPVLRPLVQALRVRRRPTKVLSGAALTQDFSPAHLAAAVEASLRRLGTDHIDVYQLHSPPLSVLGRDDVFDVLTGLRAQGKLRYFGVAADRVEPGLAQAIERGMHSLQLPVSLLDQSGLGEVVPHATRTGAGVIARSCYAAGLLNEALSVEHLREASPDWQAIVDLREQARHLGRPLLDMALQFNLAQPDIAVTILGMRSLEHLEQNLRRYDSPPLTSEEVRLLRRDAAPS